MKLENTPQIPEENQLPLKIESSEKIVSPGMETSVYRADISNPSTEDLEKKILKEVKKVSFSSLEEAVASKKFYDFLKSNPKFAKFVPSTLYFIARMQEGEDAKSYRLQKEIVGETIDSIPDEKLYEDIELDKELLDCVNGLIELFEEQIESNGDLPDLYGRKLLPNLLFNPRHTTNIMISEKPDENGQRVFFVDTSKQSQGKTSEAIDWYQKNVGGPAQLMQLKRWREKILKNIAEKEEVAKSKNGLKEAA